jgi:hypothetical protein
MKNKKYTKKSKSTLQQNTSKDENSKHPKTQLNKNSKAINQTKISQAIRNNNKRKTSRSLSTMLQDLVHILKN